MIWNLKSWQKFVCRNYKAYLLAAVFLCSSLLTFSQFNIKFRIVGVPPNHRYDSVFVAGNFNGWNPGKNGNLFLKPGDTSFIEMDSVPAGSCQFKFTRGNWANAECSLSGKDIANRQLNLSSDTMILISIKAWKDDFAPSIKQHTASANVRIIDTAFQIPQLGRTRRIWLYLPTGYSKTKKRYPVIYMQDGQNLFDSYTSSFGEWGVDECLDSMIKNGKPACIVVGIDNGPHRLTEYNPYDCKDAGKGEGDQYIDFIVTKLKPFIDRHYRTLKNNQNTIVAGSSMGGLISYYALLKYPDVFGKGGIFSPAFWTADKIGELTDSSGKELQGTIFFYIGGKEGYKSINDMKIITDKLGENSNALIYSLTDPQGEHNEKAWRKWFPEFYKWVLANGFNNVIDPEDN